MTKKEKESRTGIELQSSLARYLLTIKIGERIPNVRKLADRYQVSIGSISNALTRLELVGAAKIEKRGHLGSFLEERSLGKLWDIAEGEPLIIALTLPSNPTYEGLATGLKQLLTKAGVEAYLIFIRGSRPRLTTLREHRCHLAVMSSFAADGLCRETDEIVLNLPPGSWLSDHKVYYRRTKQISGTSLVVAIDKDSFDHECITKLEFMGQNVEYKSVSFMQIHRLLSEGKIDAAVWTKDDMSFNVNPDILERRLSPKVEETIISTEKSTSLIIRAGSDSVRAIIEESINVDELLEIQQSVIAGDIVPEY